MGMFDFITDPIASVIGGVLGVGGAQQQNQSNESIANARNAMEVAEAKKARDFSASQSAIKRGFDANQVATQNRFQERMSSTAVQRRMADMKKGGINPILAGKFDASSPAGAAASAGIGATAKANAHGYTAVNKLQPIMENIGSALQLQKVAAETKNIQANTSFRVGPETNKTTAETEYTKNKKEITDPITSLMNVLQGIINSMTGSAKDNRSLKQETTQAIHNVIKSLKKDIPKPRNKATKSKGNPLKRKIKGLPKGIKRKQFNFK